MIFHGHFYLANKRIERIIMAQIDTLGTFIIFFQRIQKEWFHTQHTSSELTEIEELHLENETGLVIQRSTFMKEDEEGSQDVTFFAMDTYKNLTIKTEDGYTAADLAENSDFRWIV